MDFPVPFFYILLFFRVFATTISSSFALSFRLDLGRLLLVHSYCLCVQLYISGD